MGNMSVIENGTKYSVFKRRVLDKNTLTHKGSLYIGAGVKEDIGEAIELEPPTNPSVLSAGNNLAVCWADDVYKYGYIKITSEKYLDLLINNNINKDEIYVIAEKENG